MAEDKQAQLEQLKADIVNQNICPELAESATQLVMGHGNPNAQVVFIGEAPGKNEDLQGIPFIGAAGKFLDQMLAQAGMKREDNYITNIVKYRPPANRDPKPEEKKAFWPFLVRELQIIQPSIIATLGRHSMEYFLPEAKISQIHGQPKRIVFGDRKLVIMPLYHPAAALYNGELKATLLEDFSTVPHVLSQLQQN
jgi:uracil-DNA glycosylase